MTEVTDAELDRVIEQISAVAPEKDELPEFPETTEFRYRVYFKGVLMARCVTSTSAGRIRAVLLKLPRPRPQASI